MHYKDILSIPDKADKIKRLAICAVFMLLGGILAGCGQEDNQKEKSPTINSVVFTRTGLFLRMSEPAAVRQVNISKDGENLVSKSVNTVGEALITFAWKGNTRYDLEVVTDKGSVSMPVYSSDRPSPVRIAEIPLEDLDKGEMEYRYYASRGGADVRFSPDGKYIGVGSKGGYVYLIDVESKKIVWKHKIPEGRASRVAFTADGKLIAGEESSDGYVYCFDVKTGEILWRYKTYADFKEKSSEITMQGRFKYYPVQVWGLCIDKENNPYVMVRHSCEREIKGRKMSVTTSRVYKFNVETGEPVWDFPIKSSAWNLKISEDGRYVIPAIGWAGEAVLYVIDSASGKPLWEYTFTCPKNGSAGFRGMTGFEAGISPDGRYVVVNQVYPDYTFVFDNQKSVRTGQPQLLWEKKFLKVLDVGGVPIAVSSVNVESTNKDLVFATWSTRAAGSAANNVQPPAQHPDADTLFVYGYDGKLKWKWKIGEGTWNSECILSKDGKFMVIPIGLVPEVPFANPSDMGIYVFSPDTPGGATAKLNWFYHTEGFAFKVDISPDNKHIVVLEGPFDIDPDRNKEHIVGKHRLIILS
jgi:outer membrane protein assembly factor BamB